MKTFLTALMTLALWPAVAAAEPSFRCTGDLTRAERTICRDDALGTLDRQVSAAYKRAYRAGDRREQRRLKAEQGAWLAYRNACLTNARCLKARYQTRLGELGGRPRVVGTVQRVNPQVLGRVVRIRPGEAPKLKVLGSQILRGAVTRKLTPIEYTAVLSAQGSDPNPPPPAAKVTADGTIEKPLSDGRVALFNPKTGERAFRNPDGTVTKLSFMEVQGDALPALPADYADWSGRVALNLSGLVGNLLKPAEVDTLQSNAPGDFFENLDYQLEILAFITS